MSTATEITRLTDARNTIRDKLIELGLSTSTAKLDDLADAVDGITNRGAVSATVQEGDTFTIPAGYHNGSGTVSGVAGGGNYSLQSKTATPTKNQQSVTPDNGYYGLSDVTVAPIPEAYQNVSAVNAAAGDVLSGKIIVDATGASVAGTMVNNGAVSKTLDATSNNQSYTVPAGYHNGSGAVNIVLEEKSVSPEEHYQEITPTAGKVLGKVTVYSIPIWYGDTTSDDAVAANLLSGKKAHTQSLFQGVPRAHQITGTMPNNGAVSKTLDATSNNQSYTVPAGYHNGSGAVNIVLETKSATPSASSQDITPTAGKVLSKVTVDPIPAKYGDTTGDDAVAANILAGKKAHSINNGAAVQLTGAMVNNGAVSHTLDCGHIQGEFRNYEYTIPEGYHNGSGKVSISIQNKSATPSTNTQYIIATAGTVMGQVTVNPIPARFGDTTGDDAVAANILAGKKAHSISAGAAVAVTGTMVNNGAVAATIDGLTTTSYTVPAGYHDGSGTVSLTGDIEAALAAI